MISRSTDIRGALRSRQRGFLLNPFRFGGGGSLAYSPWNAGSLPANVTASEAGYKLTRSGGSNGVRGVYHPVSRSAGKYAVRFLVKAAGASSQASAAGILSGSIGAYLGASAGGLALWANSSGGTNDQFFSNGSSLAPGAFAGGAFTSDTEVWFEIDLGAGKAWGGINGYGWRTGNPATGASPLYTWTPGASYTLAADMYYDGSTVQLLTPTDFLTPASSGFTAGWPD